MSSIVCNCNSFSHIDYGMPILFHKTDYRTSTERGLAYQVPFRQEFYRNKDNIGSSGCHIFPKLDNYKTTSSIAYTTKYKEHNSNGESSLALPVNKTHYLRQFKEKIFKNPPAPRKFTVTTYDDDYQIKSNPIIRGIPPEIKSVAICNISNVGLGEQPRIKIEDIGVTKHLDPYVSQTQMVHIPFTKNQLDQANSKYVNIYNAKQRPEVINTCLKKTPIYNKYQFSGPIYDKIVPRLVYRVPFSGKTSEYMGKYVPPTKGCFYSKLFIPGTTFDESFPNADLYQTLAPPNMYCTEYCHIKYSRPVEASVNTKKEKNKFRHNDCGYMKN